MKKLFPLVVIVSFILLSQTTISSCTKTNTNTIRDTVMVTDTITVYPIQGLWSGTYASTVNGSTNYILNFSVYADGTMTYYSTGSGNTTFFAKGTWSLSGTTFSFSVVETTSAHTQTGTAVYDSTNGTLTGTLSDAAANSSANFTLNKVN